MASRTYIITWPSVPQIVRHLRACVPAIGLGAAIGFLAASLATVRWNVLTPVGSTGGWTGHLVVLLVIAIAPAIALGLYVYCRDRYYNESLKLLVVLFFYGVLSAPLAGLCEQIAAGLLGYEDETASVAAHFFFYFFVVGLFEELAKFIVARKLTYRSRQFKQVYDGVLFCTAAALGFATIENICYVFTAGPIAMEVAIGRALTAVPSHVADAVVMGYAMGRARAVRGTHREHDWLLRGLFGAVLFHGAYDFVLTVGSGNLLLFLPIMLAGWVAAYLMLRKGTAFSPFTRCEKCSRVLPRLASHCPFCGQDRFVELTCRSCGAGLSKWASRCTSCYARVRFPWHLRVEHLANLFRDRPFEACPSCEEQIPAGTRYCLHCGQRRAEPASRLARRGLGLARAAN